MDRYYFVKPWKELQSGEHQAITSFALQLSERFNAKLAICVHSISHCEQILEKCFPLKTQVNKLLRRELLIINNVPIVIESVKTIKKSVDHQSRIYLALFPSPELLSLIEKSNSKKAIIVFSETLDSDHLIDWKEKFNPSILESKEV